MLDNRGMLNKKSSLFWGNFDKIPSWSLVHTLGAPAKTWGWISFKFFPNVSIDSTKDIDPP